MMVDRDKDGAAMDTADQVMELFRSRPSSRLTFRQIASGLHGRHEDLSRSVDRLVEEGLLWPAGGRRYALPEELGIARGRIVMRSDGSGFIMAGDIRIEIDRRNTAGSLDGDTVVARRLQQLPGEGRFRGKVERVVERKRDGVSGIARRRGRRWVLDPIDPVLPRSIPLRTPARSDLEEGRLIFALLDYSGRMIEAELSVEIGSAGSPSNLIDSVVMDHGLSIDFPEDVYLESQEAALRPWDLEGREDFRELLTVTVDPVDARDFDDAVSFSSEESVRILYIHIADVARYVPGGSLTDGEARARGTSVYLPDRVIPMLPQVLSNGACSLVPEEERLTRTVVMRFDESGQRIDFEIVPSVIVSDRRMTYEEALQYLDGSGSDEALRDLFSELGRLSADLESKREARGALDLESTEYKAVFGEDGWPEGFSTVPSDRSHRMIENFMIEANRAVADHCSWMQLPVLYRVHEEPTEISGQLLLQRLDDIGVELPRGRIHSPDTLRRLLESVKGTPKSDLVTEYVLRSLQKAVYLPGNSGHFGLALRSYMHFTSPIRRYPDLIVHQVLSEMEKGRVPSPRDLSFLARQTSASEDNAESAERDSEELMGLLYLSRSIGDVFEGLVTGVKDFGIFVRLEGIPVEGLVHRSEMGMAVGRGDKSGGPFSLGSSIRVEVLDVDILQRKLSLRPAGE